MIRTGDLVNPMFDGVDPVTLCTPEPDAAIELYEQGLGFRVTADSMWSPDPWRRVWGLPEGGPMRVVELRKPRAHGGGIRIVHVPEVPVVCGDRRPDTPGPYAWDFYVRDMAAAVERIEALGWRFRSEPQRYQLFGQDFEVVECMLEGPQGLLHAFVEYLPNRHRCVLGIDEAEAASEVIALVVVVPEVSGPLAVMVDGLGADVAMDEHFFGPEVERLLDLPEGSAFRMSLMRGPTRRSARFELLGSLEPDRPLGAHPVVIAPMPVPDLDAAVERIRACAPSALAMVADRLAVVDLAPGVRLTLHPATA